MKALVLILVFGMILVLLNPGMSHKAEITLRASNQDGYKIVAEKTFFFETSIFRQDDMSSFFPLRLGRALLTTPSTVISADILDIQNQTDVAIISIIKDDKSGLILETDAGQGRVSLPAFQIETPLDSGLDFGISLNVCDDMCSIVHLNGEVTLKIEKRFRLISIFNLRGV